MRAFFLKKPVRRIIFTAMLILAFLPFLIFPYVSRNYHRLHNMPSLNGGAIDLSGYDFSNPNEIPLDGEWEFYYDRWIISEPDADRLPDMMAPVPRPWTSYRIGGEQLAVEGRASYRIILKNCPGDAPLVVYIPNISSQYRTYINGKLVSSKGSMDSGGTLPDNGKVYHLGLQGISVEEGSDAEVVIELQSPHIGGLYLTPVLGEQDPIHIGRDMRNIIAAACIGVLLLSILCIICFMFLRDKLLYSFTLAAMDILVCLRFLARDEFFEVLKNVAPPYHYYLVNSVLRVATFFLPVIFLFSISQLIHLKIRRRLIYMIGFYELLLSPILLWCVLNGRIRRVFFIGIAGYLPFLYIGWLLYREIMKGTLYSLLMTSSFLFIVSSMLSASLGDSGLLVMSISLFSPVCFVVAMIFQLVLFIWRSFELRIQAAAAENLQLRLKDSETSLMLSQIQPHFIYNTLIAIHMLCLEEPETAAETTLKFATFLRTNMKFIRSPYPIPFTQELEHIKNYAAIEEIRFKNRLHMCYQIETAGFFVPSLTIQPLVENAIRHGASKNVEGGRVILHTFEAEGASCIEITDDGPGFDTGILETAADNSFGIANVTFRLREQIHAEIKISSTIGKGTAVRITIPKGGAQHESDSH